MSTSTERLGRTRVRVGAPAGGVGRCQIRAVTTQSDPAAAVVRAVVVAHDARHARVALVPEGALLLAGDAIEIDITVDADQSLEIIEPGGTVAFDMRGGAARWDVRIRLGDGARLRWAGLPFVVAAGADVSRSVHVTCGDGARVALRETLVLGRFGEQPGRLHQTSTMTSAAGTPVLVEQLPLNPDTTPLLLGGHRVVTSVIAMGADELALTTAGEHRYDLDVDGAVLWRRLGVQAHETALDEAWRACARIAG